MQRNKISFKGQKIFVGIDVHAKNWEVEIAPEVGIVKRHSQMAAKLLFLLASIVMQNITVCAFSV